MKLGIIGPSEDEINPFVEMMNTVETHRQTKLDFHVGVYNHMDVVALYSGVCKVNAAISTQVLIDKFDVTHVIVVGVAGGINKQLKIGDTVIGTEIGYHDVADEILTEYHPWMDSRYFKTNEEMIKICKAVVKEEQMESSVYFGKIVTGESFITQEGRQDIIKTHDPLCVDMETGSIAHVCYVNDLPFMAIRAITDTDEECGVEVFEENCVDVSKKAVNMLKLVCDKISSKLYK